MTRILLLGIISGFPWVLIGSSKGLTVPQIVINSEPIGGFEDLVKYFDANL